MQTHSFEEIVARIVRSDRRYASDAFCFVRDALNHTQEGHSRSRASSGKTGSKVAHSHVTGQELLEGIRQFALNAYGPMAYVLLQEWGVTRCEDFGEIVFLLVEHGALSKTEKDQRSDFQNGYDFESAFQKPFRPERLRIKTQEPASQP